MRAPLRVVVVVRLAAHSRTRSRMGKATQAAAAMALTQA
jgi:hypothetical protein